LKASRLFDEDIRWLSSTDEIKGTTSVADAKPPPDDCLDIRRACMFCAPSREQCVIVPSMVNVIERRMIATIREGR
jgi:hypothetical protein